MRSSQPVKIKTIADYHQLMDLQKPEHPLISVINFEAIKRLSADKPQSLIHDFYSVALKRNFNGKMKYGQLEYDFDEGVMIFIAPGQVFTIEADEALRHSGWLLLVHPDYLWNTSLATTIKQYDYFGYSTHEALHLSEKEEITVTTIMQHIEQEYRSTTDSFRT